MSTNQGRKQRRHQQTNPTSPTSDDGDDRQVAGQLWTISCKVRGIGELIRNRSGEPSLDESEVNLGIGEILIGLADELQALRLNDASR